MNRSIYHIWWLHNEMQKIMFQYWQRSSPPSREERLKEMTTAFAPAIDIPPEITIRCFEFSQWWECRLKSETLEFEKGIVPKGSLIIIEYLPLAGMREKAIFVSNWLADRGWKYGGKQEILIPGEK